MDTQLYNNLWVQNIISNNNSFAIWRNPNAKKINYTICDSNELIQTDSYQDLDKFKGFVFAPFKTNQETPIYIIPFTNKNINAKNITKRTINKQNKNNSTTKQQYIDQCNKFIKTLEQDNIKKAVLAQNQWFEEYDIQQMPNLFYKLCEQYKTAFVYQIYIPEVGFWSGASPELLLKTDKDKAKTVSLAGTQKINENQKKIIWDKKEKDEQSIVTQHIKDVLLKLNINKYTEHNTKTIKAAQVAHLKTEITFNSASIKEKIGQFVELLHPTPAVCGLPTKQSLNMILKTEKFNRSYYSGFLGELNFKKKINLFVNLRCLQAYTNGVYLYSGAGITPQSDPQKEWKETQLKMQTLLEILKKCKKKVNSNK